MVLIVVFAAMLLMSFGMDARQSGCLSKVLVDLECIEFEGVTYKKCVYQCNRVCSTVNEIECSPNNDD